MFRAFPIILDFVSQNFFLYMRYKICCIMSDVKKVSRAFVCRNEDSCQKTFQEGRVMGWGKVSDGHR